MDLQALYFFCVVAKEGNISKASQKLHYAQPYLSTKISQLEQEFNVSLFYRTNNGVMLTSKGKIMLSYAEKTLSLLDEMTKVVSDDGSANGTLNIGSIESNTFTFLPDFLTKYHQKNPNVSVKVETDGTNILLQKVLEHKLDGAFVGGTTNNPQLCVLPVRKEEMVMISSKLIKEKNISDLLELPLVVFQKGFYYRDIFEQWLLKENIVPTQIFDFTSISSMFASVIAGLGIAMLPKSAVDFFHVDNLLNLHKVPEEYAYIETTFVYRKDTFLSSAMKCFIKSIQGEV